MSQWESPPPESLAYDRFRAAGLDIGWGQVEAACPGHRAATTWACNHVVALRRKRSSMRWSKPGSQNGLSLRTGWLNGDWHALGRQRPLIRAA
jgi:hypothetical protein